MEYVDGRTLADILEDGGPLDPARAARIAGPSPRPSAAAHARGLIHRDVKPPTSTRRTPKVMDFGIARLARRRRADRDLQCHRHRPYMSPEQAQAHDVDGRADIYSLGVCLYECLTGQAPFSGDSPVAVATKHVNEPPRPPRTASRDPAGARGDHAHGRRQAADDRYQTAGELRDDVERALAGRAGPRPGGRRRRRRARRRRAVAARQRSRAAPG